MTRTLLSALLLTLSAPVFASSERAEWCKAVHMLSHAIMQSRQNHESLPHVMETVNRTDNEGFKAFASAIIFDAYSKRVYHYHEYKEQAARKFANDHYMDCMKKK